MKEAHAIAAAAEAVQEAAREHKRLAAQHRRKARSLMRRLSELRELCAQHGIKLTILDGEAKEDAPHGR